MRFLIVSLLLGVAVSADVQRREVTDTPAVDPSSKLTTVLADLSQAVTQQAGAATTQASTGSSAALAVEKMPRSVQDAVQGHRLRIDANNAVQVYILMSEVSPATIQQLTTAGVTIELQDAAHHRVQARVPATRLQAVAQLAVVNSIRLPTYARRRTGTVASEGDTILHADTVRATWGLDGSGVRVGVISDGLKGVFASSCTTSCPGALNGPISSGDLPTSVGVRNAAGVLLSSSGGILGRSFQSNGDLEGLPPITVPACSFAGAGAEGTALLEIVHDLAPGAKLSFANGDTDLSFNQAVNFLAASNDIVLDDIGFFGEPYDGTSNVSANTAAALNNATFPIRAYFTSVGNDADEHYYGAYTDSRVDGTTVNGISNTGHLHLFQSSADTTDVLGLGARPYNVISLPTNGEVAIFLSWNDPFGGSANNYDMYLVQQSTGRVVASSTDQQNGRQDPVEVIDFVNKGAQDFFQIVVQNVHDAAQPRNLNIFSFEPECAAAGPALLSGQSHARHNYNTATHSIAAQSDAGGSPASVVAVGAICSASASAANAVQNDESCRDTSNSTAEFFSSQGPTLDGRVKPDIAAIDGVSITGAGTFPVPFFGTSAASPHMGGIAALALQNAPCLLGRSTSTVAPDAARIALRQAIIGGAGALSAAPPDNVFGAGRADAFASVSVMRPSFTGAKTTLTVDGNTAFGATVTPAQLGFTDPNSCPLVSLNWSGDCGTPPGATMTCSFGTNSVSVTASNNGLAYSDAVGLQVVVTNFAVSLSPSSVTLKAGQTSSHLVTVTPQGGPYNTPVTLSCASGNLPPQTSCSFDPPTVVPGVGGATSRMTVLTISSSAVPPTSIEPGGPSTWRALRRVNWTPSLLWLTLIGFIALGARRLPLRRPLILAVRFAAVAIALAPAVYLGAGSVRAAALDQGIALFPAGVTFVTPQTLSTTTTPQSVFLSNIGSDPLSIVGISTTGDFSQINNCGTAVNAGASCTINVSFTPTVIGARTGTISVADGATGSPHTVTLAGTGQAAPSSNGGTPTGSYTLTVSGTAGTLSNFAPLTLTVQ